MSEICDKELRKICKSIDKGELTVEDLKQAVSKKKRQIKRLAKKSKKSGNTPKKEPSSYIKFSNYHRPEVKKTFEPRQVMGELARRWGLLSEEEKLQWKKKARTSRSRSPRRSPKRSTKKSPRKSPKKTSKRSTNKSKKARRSS